MLPFAALSLLLAPDPELPMMLRVKSELLRGWRCVDTDGFTLCDPTSQPVDIEFTYFACEPDKPRSWMRVAAECTVEGRLKRGFGRFERWEPISRMTVFLWIEDRPGATWRAE